MRVVAAFARPPPCGAYGGDIVLADAPSVDVVVVDMCMSGEEADIGKTVEGGDQFVGIVKVPCRCIGTFRICCGSLIEGHMHSHDNWHVFVSECFQIPFQPLQFFGDNRLVVITLADHALRSACVDILYIIEHDVVHFPDIE